MTGFGRFILMSLTLTTVWLAPLGNRVFAQASYSRLVGVDRESGEALIHAGSDARFARFGEMARAELGGGEITRDDVVWTNPGKIIYVCRHPDGSRQLSRRAELHDGCPPRSRSYWLVNGATYHVPMRVPDLPDVSAGSIHEENVALRSAIRDLSEQVRALREQLRTNGTHDCTATTGNGGRTTMIGHQTDQTQPSPTPVPVANAPHAGANRQNFDWASALIGFLIAACLCFVFFALIVLPRRDLRHAMHEEDVQNTLRARFRRAHARYRLLLAAWKKRFALMREELDETRTLLRERSGHRQTPLTVVNLGSDGEDHDDANVSRIRPAMGTPSEKPQMLSSPNAPTPEERVAILQAEVATLQRELDRRERLRNRIPELMAEMERLKPSWYDVLRRRLLLLHEMKNEMTKEKRSSREVAPLESLLREYNGELETYQASPQGMRYGELKGELRQAIFEATGMRNSSLAEEAWLVLARRALDEDFALARAERVVLADLTRNYREALADLRRSKREDETTKKIYLKNGGATASTNDDRISELERRVAELSGTVRGQGARLVELEERRSSQDAAIADLRAGLEASYRERSGLHLELGEAKAVAEGAVTLLRRKHIPRDTPWGEKLHQIRSEQRSRREPNFVPSADAVEFFHALAKFLDSFKPGQTNVVEVKEADMIDLTHLAYNTQLHLKGEPSIEGLMGPGGRAPLRSLPYTVAMACGGSIPDRMRTPTIFPPGMLH